MPHSLRISADLSALSDAELVDLVVERRTDALAHLYDRNAARATAAALRILRNMSDAQDLVHDVFIEVWQRSQTFDARRGTFPAWLLARVNARSIDRIRHLEVARRHRMAANAAQEHDRNSLRTDEASAVDDRHRRSELEALIGGLSEVQRTVIELAYFRGWTCQEIAMHCAVPLGTIKSRLSAALRTLRRLYTEKASG